MAKYWVDPPSGWRYGFPKVYCEEENEGSTFEEWLIKEGYPKKIIESYGKHFDVRMWGYKEKEDVY